MLIAVGQRIDMPAEDENNKNGEMQNKKEIPRVLLEVSYDKDVIIYETGPVINPLQIELIDDDILVLCGNNQVYATGDLFKDNQITDPKDNPSNEENKGKKSEPHGIPARFKRLNFFDKREDSKEENILAVKTLRIVKVKQPKEDKYETIVYPIFKKDDKYEQKSIDKRETYVSASSKPSLQSSDYAKVNDFINEVQGLQESLKEYDYNIYEEYNKRAENPTEKGKHIGLEKLISSITKLQQNYKDKYSKIQIKNIEKLDISIVNRIFALLHESIHDSFDLRIIYSYMGKIATYNERLIEAGMQYTSTTDRLKTYHTKLRRMTRAATKSNGASKISKQR
jgi:hypothetical protein